MYQGEEWVELCFHGVYRGSFTLFFYVCYCILSIGFIHIQSLNLPITKEEWLPSFMEHVCQIAWHLIPHDCSPDESHYCAHKGPSLSLMYPVCFLKHHSFRINFLIVSFYACPWLPRGPCTLSFLMTYLYEFIISATYATWPSITHCLTKSVNHEVIHYAVFSSLIHPLFLSVQSSVICSTLKFWLA